jgi:hypothetical protein
MRLFDDLARTDGSPKKASEDSFAFLNRAAGPFWAAIRDELERWVADYPTSHESDLMGRFRKRAPDQHWGAWWELYLFRLFSCMGFAVEVHPEMPETTTHPDFKLRRERTVYDLPRLWMNPWAARPLGMELPLPLAVVEDERLVLTEATRPPHEVFGLPPDWPGDPDSRFVSTSRGSPKD